MNNIDFDRNYYSTRRSKLPKQRKIIKPDIKKWKSYLHTDFNELIKMIWLIQCKEDIKSKSFGLKYSDSKIRKILNNVDDVYKEIDWYCEDMAKDMMGYMYMWRLQKYVEYFDESIFQEKSNVATFKNSIEPIINLMSLRDNLLHDVIKELKNIFGKTGKELYVDSNWEEIISESFPQKIGKLFEINNHIKGELCKIISSKNLDDLLSTYNGMTIQQSIADVSYYACVFDFFRNVVMSLKANGINHEVYAEKYQLGKKEIYALKMVNKLNAVDLQQIIAERYRIERGSDVFRFINKQWLYIHSITNYYEKATHLDIKKRNHLSDLFNELKFKNKSDNITEILERLRKLKFPNIGKLEIAKD